MTALNLNCQILIVGGGAAGISTAASLLARDASLQIMLVDPADTHYYQPGWTMVGAGVFEPQSTARSMESLIPKGVQWIKAAVATFEPQDNALTLEDGRSIGYQQLVVCPGLKLDWAAIDGLVDTLGANGVTSNYRYDLAPYTWKLVQGLKQGRALFTQPPMPIKCAGAPQKALYLSCDHWLKAGRLGQINAQFYNAGGVLFGVADYVPALMTYVQRYAIDLKFSHRLIAVDGPGKRATFIQTLPDGTCETVEQSFEMLHVGHRRLPRTSSATARWPMRQAGWTWIPPRSGTAGSPTFMAWAMSPTPAMPRRPRQRASRRRWRPTTCWLRWVV
ncbi:Uncharacterized protein ALO54_01268 [Pseudomonas syringae pv. philadelphi]|nr:Uncharacterized protein ALO86_02756 [Pseudomonas syringae pv. berberidis]KPY09803.1 Uncharacterized protein ALO54_01268 [Pseudomonas syringae pv. philadelphi]RMM13309.1 hypothetical protein ALQ83_03579 [Pseudomonas syringae pv. berberidis]RMP72750.1 hypothetical protein ALQ19_04282 [Pseudomonas syringae pv. berberidis]RMQ28414.1 hypothetical protein ALQ06_03561 [Pseudomonas syringae pv. berberidis]